MGKPPVKEQVKVRGPGKPTMAARAGESWPAAWHGHRRDPRRSGSFNRSWVSFPALSGSTRVSVKTMPVAGWGVKTLLPVTNN